MSDRSLAKNDLSAEFSFSWADVDLELHDDIIGLYFYDLTKDEFKYLLPGVIKSSKRSEIHESEAIDKLLFMISGVAGMSKEYQTKPGLDWFVDYSANQIEEIVEWLSWIRQRFQIEESHEVPLNPVVFSQIDLSISYLNLLKES